VWPGRFFRAFSWSNAQVGLPHQISIGRAVAAESKSTHREELLLAAALEMPADKREAFLMGACLGDSALRERLEALLAADARRRTGD